MALPKQARDQVEEANRILNEISGDGPQMEIVDAPPVEPPPVEDPPAAEAPPVEEPPVEEPPPAAPEVDWEQRYSVLQGKYNAEVPQLHKDLKDLKELVSNLQSTPAPAVEAPAPATLVTADDISEFGQDFFDAVGRRAREIYDPVVGDLKTQVSELKQQLGGVSATVVESAKDKVLNQLDSNVEDWRELNERQDFLDWLAKADPYSGEPRGKMLHDAFDANDAERVSAFFTGFKNEHAAVAPQPAAADSESDTRTPAVDLNDHVAPGKAARPSSPASAQSQKNVWTRPQIVEFYKDCQLGKFKNDPQRREQIERDIFAAQAEGRIK